jgi:phosphatidylserine synthase 2
LALLTVMLGIACMAWRNDSDHQTAMDNRFAGVTAMTFMLIVTGALTFPAGPFIRPHPSVWRAAFSIALASQMWLIFMLFQTRDEARQLMRLLDDTLGVDLSERSYADDCTFTWSVVKDNIFDRFFVSHFVGWVLKALMLRDFYLCWFVSVTWELVEIALTHMLPNFAECWWDQLLLDVLLTNAMGIYIGCKLGNYFEVRSYEIFGFDSIHSVADATRRTALQFTPERWSHQTWAPFTTIKRFFGVQIFIIGLHVQEANSFFLKSILWVAPESSLNVYRLIIWWMIGLPMCRQVYVYMTDAGCKRLGAHTFLGASIMSTELMIMLKFGRGLYTESMPQHLKYVYWTLGVVYVLTCFFVIRHSTRSSGGSSSSSS